MALNRRLRFTILRRDDFTCQYCGRKAPEVVLHVDHRYPRALGGTDEPSNLVTSCIECNSGKHTLTIPIEFQFVDGGPLEGNTVRRLDSSPVEWVWRAQDGDLVTLSDALSDAPECDFSVRCVYGPGLVNRPDEERRGPKADKLRSTDTGRAELLGAYVCWIYMPEHGFAPEMHWMTPAMLLLQLDVCFPSSHESRNPIRG